MEFSTMGSKDLAGILIVDDDCDLAEGLAELLTLRGHDVDIAGNGREAVERFRARDYDLAFMDVRMPVMDGIAGFFAIRALKPEARIVMMTGFRDDGLDRVMQSGAAGLMNKPFAMSLMFDQIESVVRP